MPNSSSVEVADLVASLNDYVPHRVRQAMDTLQHAVGPVTGYIDPTAMWEVLENFQSELGGGRHLITATAGSVTVVSLTLTVGYVFWTIKGGYLVASVMSAMPAWRFMDPLPILDATAAANWRDRDDEENEIYELD
jgi:hypothetical protein